MVESAAKVPGILALQQRAPSPNLSPKGGEGYACPS